MAQTERIVLEHEVTTEYKLIREISRIYITRNGVERLWDTERPPNHEPGTLKDDNGTTVYIKTDTKDLPTDVKFLADRFWTEEVHHLFEQLKREQAAQLIQ